MKLCGSSERSGEVMKTRMENEKKDDVVERSIERKRKTWR